MTAAIKFNPIYLPVNRGHGDARRTSFDMCINKLIALMDADDVSLPYRFEKQLKAFTKDEALDVVGGQISEFIDTTSNVIARRVVPINDREIKSYAKKRCPMNQVSVMLRKDAYDKAGGYIDWYCEEDYYLWLRMIQAGCRFANVSEDLVYVRVGDAMSARRGGMKYFKSEEKLQRYMLKQHLISFPRYIYNTALRFGGEVLIPTRLRTKLFKALRSKPEEFAAKEIIKSQTCQSSDETNYPPFSVAMCVYEKDNPEWFDKALSSIVNQTVKPNEIVLVVDGPIPDTIQSVIDKYSQICGGGVTFNVIYFETNRGHGDARRAGLEVCKNELVALMDADDICVKDRFEQQLKFYSEHDVDIVGGDIAEFIGTIDNIVAYRNVPLMDYEIKQYMKKRCPFNQMTVMFKKSSVQGAGGYIDWYCDEDYYLWLRMAQNGCKMMNTGTVLVNARVGKDMYNRRGGKKYFKSEAKLQKYMLDNKIIGFGTYFMNVSKRFIVQILLPNKIRGWVFKKFARKKV